MGALEGIRVVDVGLLVQGPQAGQTLRDLGAEVIKVELPGLGDMARWIPISMEDLRTPYFEACNRGKKSITIDLRVTEGAYIFRNLVDAADVLVANFKPGTLEAWGLSYEELSKTNPGLIYAMGSTFGPEGKGADREGADLAGQAAGGDVHGSQVPWLCLSFRGDTSLRLLGMPAAAGEPQRRVTRGRDVCCSRCRGS